jgi:hypothetical protein
MARSCHSEIWDESWVWHPSPQRQGITTKHGWPKVFTLMWDMGVMAGRVPHIWVVDNWVYYNGGHLGDLGLFLRNYLESGVPVSSQCLSESSQPVVPMATCVYSKARFAVQPGTPFCCYSLSLFHMVQPSKGSVANIGILLLGLCPFSACQLSFAPSLCPNKWKTDISRINILPTSPSSPLTNN